LTPAIIQQAIEAGDKLCYETVMTAGRHTGIALSNLLNVLNPGLVILGGSVIEFFPVMLETIRNTVRERTLVKIGQGLEICQAQKDWRGAIIGSAIMAHNILFCID
jgi:glucokinase